MTVKDKDKISNILNHIYNSTDVGFVSNTNDFLHDNTTLVDLLVNRGAGYTKSCGSGATAAAICLFKLFDCAMNQNE